jgi:hypothetical protein
MAAKKSVKKPVSAKSAKKKSAKKTGKTTKRESPDSTAASGKSARTADAKAKGSGILASAVNMGHIFALRPRATTAFPQQALLDAKQSLADETYPSIEKAARAVADKALDITHDGARPRRGHNTPRF